MFINAVNPHAKHNMTKQSEVFVRTEADMRTRIGLTTEQREILIEYQLTEPVSAVTSARLTRHTIN